MYLFVKDVSTGDVRRLAVDERSFRVLAERDVLNPGSTLWKLGVLDGGKALIGHNQENGSIRIWTADANGDFRDFRTVDTIDPEWKLNLAYRGIFGHRPTQEIGFWRIVAYDSPLVPTPGTERMRIGPEWRDMQLMNFHLENSPQYTVWQIDIFGRQQDTADLRVWYTTGDWNSNVLYKGEGKVGNIGLEWRIQAFAGEDPTYFPHPTIFGHRNTNEVRRWTSRDYANFDGGVEIGRIGFDWNLIVGRFAPYSIYDLLGQQNGSGSLQIWRYDAADKLVGNYSMGSFPNTVLLNHLFFN